MLEVENGKVVGSHLCRLFKIEGLKGDAPSGSRDEPPIDNVIYEAETQGDDEVPF